MTETVLVDPPPHEVRRRIREQRKKLYPQTWMTGLAVVVGPAAGVAAGTAVGLITRDPRLAFAVALLAAGLVFIRAWAWLRDPVRRTGWEVAVDHARREAQEWKRWHLAQRSKLDEH